MANALAAFVELIPPPTVKAEWKCEEVSFGISVHRSPDNDAVETSRQTSSPSRRMTLTRAGMP